MTDLVIVALINGAIAIILVVLGARLNGKVNQIRDDAGVTRDQVKNTHETNFREDVDKIGKAVSEGFSEMTRKFTRSDELHAETRRDVSGLRQEIGQLRQVERDQWEAIEQTRPKARPRATNRKE